jgi:hypothetical protein
MNKVVTHVAVGVTALGLGGIVGYFIGKKRADKAADVRIAAIDNYWKERIEEVEGPAAIITSGEEIHPGDVLTLKNSEDEGENYEVIEQLKTASQELLAESTPMYADQASELEDDEAELPPDFPEVPAVADDFTVEGQAPAVDARAFVEQFKNRTVGEFASAVTFDGEDPSDIPLKTVPDFVVVRDPNGPYVISIDDYMDPETDPPFTKVEMRWFKGDNVVVDARDDQVPMSTVGQKNTERFGEGTTDPSQVYIRNERLSIDIELTLEEGLYLHEVLGQDFPDKTPVLKMRERDDG